jgi:uncharacterized protein
MSGETNLAILIKGMTPVLSDEPYGFICMEKVASVGSYFALITEDEGTTIIATRDSLEAAGLSVPSLWARITLHIHSALEAVGLTAAFARALGDVSISANVIAGFHHDHIFVQWEKRHEAMNALTTLSKNA